MVARQTPSGTMLEDGHSTKVAFSADPDVSFWEKTVTPPGVDGGDPIEITTMFNVDWRTMAARALKTLTESSLTVAYDPKVYDQIVALVNVPGLITAHFPDTSRLEFYGYLQKADFSELKEGEQPEATIKIQPTNVNPSNGAEVAPNYYPPGSA